MATYYIAPNGTSGSGTIGDPYGMPDLLNTNPSPVGPGVALTTLRAGDTLYFRGGTYHVTGDTASWDWQMISPTYSGTPESPITVSAYPGETPLIVRDEGLQPILGTGTPLVNYIRFIGITVQCARTQSAYGDSLIYMKGIGCEVAYCEIIGQYEPTTDNHDGIVAHGADNVWIHHNNIHGCTGLAGQWNSSGIKLYKNLKTLVEDNYTHNNMAGIFDKDGGTLPIADGSHVGTHRRNYTAANTIGGFKGNGQGAKAILYVYDNVLDGCFDLGGISIDCEYYNNLELSPAANPIGAGKNVYAMNDQYMWRTSIWNNIVLGLTSQSSLFIDSHVPYTFDASDSPLAYFDYNLYDATPGNGPPAYYIGGSDGHTNYSFTFAEFQAEGAIHTTQGLEAHTLIRSASGAPPAIFQDLTNYELNTQWLTAGRYGDPIGPRFPIATIMDTTRYGPAVLTPGNNPAITLQPQDQIATEGGTATFGTTVTGTGLFYHWQRSNDSGTTWTMIMDENASSYTTPVLSLTDDGALFQCLISGDHGSVWSNLATLTVNEAVAGTSSASLLMDL